jgi:hypothetical protein
MDPGWVKKSGSGMNNPIIFPSLKSNFWVKILKFFDVDPGSGMEKIGIRDKKKSDPGSGINIPDPQHCLRCSCSGSGSGHKLAKYESGKKHLGSASTPLDEIH